MELFVLLTFFFACLVRRSAFTVHLKWIWHFGTWHMAKQKKKSSSPFFDALLFHSFAHPTIHHSIFFFTKKAFNILGVRWSASHDVITSILQSDNRISMFGRWMYVCYHRLKGKEREKKNNNQIVNPQPKDIMQTFSSTQKRVNATKNVQIVCFWCGYFSPSLICFFFFFLLASIQISKSLIHELPHHFQHIIFCT